MITGSEYQSCRTEWIPSKSLNRQHNYIHGPEGHIVSIWETRNMYNHWMYYTVTDYLGSITDLVGHSGWIEESRTFDAWGRMRSASTWTEEPPTYGSMTDEGWDRGFTGHEHLPQFGIINMNLAKRSLCSIKNNNHDAKTNGRLYDPVMGRMFSPDPYIMGADNTQGYNRYTYALNNPLKYTDPTGEVALEWLGGFFSRGGGLGSRMAAGDERVRNMYKIVGGLFAWDGTYTGKGDFWRDVWQVISRHTWEAPQTILGFNYSYFSNLFGETNSVEYYHGATISTRNRGSNSVSLGSYIKLGGQDNETRLGIGEGSYATMHEYGHYLQSREFGFIYLTKVGIPSLTNARWTEHDANYRAARYFQGVHPTFTWDENYYRRSSPFRIYSNFRVPGFENNSPVRAKWWEFLIPPPYLFGVVY